MHLVKHHGLGNDFLIALDQVGDRHEDGDLARRLCDRRRGIGADGLILTGPAGGDCDATMHLYNADGSRAELSGNGIRCLAHAMVRAGMGEEAPGVDNGRVLRVATDAGDREIVLTGDRDDDPATGHTVYATVTMGRATAGPDVPPSAAELLAELGVREKDVTTIDVGNPHLVIRVDHPDRIDLARYGAQLEACFDRGANIHFIASRGDGLDLRVWERGAGVTEACGTGATAAALAAHRWGLVDSPIEVAMPGGTATVDVDGAELLRLRGPSTFVASIEVDR